MEFFIVSFQVNNPTAKVVLNSAEISISSASFTADGGEEVASSNIDYEPEHEKVTIEFPKELATGMLCVIVKFVLLHDCVPVPYV